MRILLLLVALVLASGCQRFAAVLPGDDSKEYQPPELDYTLPPTTSGGRV
jgi:flagellar L-ring protein precursor FlgH